MSPVTTAYNSVRHAIGSFHPAAAPVMSRASYRRELVAWLFLPIMMGAVEGGVTGVIAKNAFAGTVSDTWLNWAVALLSGAPAFSNVTSFLWASLSHGRNKIRFLVALQIMAAILIAQIGFAPTSGLGLAMLMVGAIGARMCWSGVITLRATVWRANYPEGLRARLAGRLSTVQAVVLGLVSLTIALAMRADAGSYAVLYPAVAAFGVIGAWTYGRLRMRGHRALINDERADTRTRRSGIGIGPIVRILREDRHYRRYMIVMTIFGTGNLMAMAPLVIMLRDVFGLAYLEGIMITSTVPLLMMPFTIPAWSSLLDRVHVIRFRMIHSWAFVAATAMVLVAVLTGTVWLLWAAAAMKGVAYGGGVLGWNLGHHDFAPAERTSAYMGVHVTLTGLRGLVAPALGVAIYTWFAQGLEVNGGWVFAVCLAINVTGALAFAWLGRTVARERTPVR